MSFLSKKENSPSGEFSWTQRLKQGLTRSRQELSQRISTLFKTHPIDAALYEELETILLTADVGVKATENILHELKLLVKSKNIADAEALKQTLKQLLIDLLSPLQQPLDTSSHKPFVIMLAGVNGSGKTTSIGKLAHYFQLQGQSVLLAAGDTFRAAAREQLGVWADRNQVNIITQQGADPAAVIFDAIHAAKARNHNIVLADTAGRLPTQLHLMEEIKKIKRVIAKADATAPHEVLLVLDATLGQNTLNQVKAFDQALGVTGLILTKLDGTAKGGIVAALAQENPTPIRFIGVGESIDDLRPFVASEFVEALLES